MVIAEAQNVLLLKQSSQCLWQGNLVGDWTRLHRCFALSLHSVPFSKLGSRFPWDKHVQGETCGSTTIHSYTVPHLLSQVTWNMRRRNRWRSCPRDKQRQRNGARCRPEVIGTEIWQGLMRSAVAVCSSLMDKKADIVREYTGSGSVIAVPAPQSLPASSRSLVAPTIKN